MAIIDKSLHFGMQNFMFAESDETTDATYNFYGFVNRKGTVLLMRLLKDGSAAKYCVSSDDFTTAFAARKDATYVFPNELSDLAV